MRATQRLTISLDELIINLGMPLLTFPLSDLFYDEKNYFSSASEHLDEKPIYQKLSEQKRQSTIHCIKTSIQLTNCI